MNLFKLLEAKDIVYEDLNSAERETFTQMATAYASKELTVADIKEYIQKAKISVENDLAAYDLPKDKDLLLKARLRNYIMLLDFLDGPEKAKRWIEQAINNLK